MEQASLTMNPPSLFSRAQRPIRSMFSGGSSAALVALEIGPSAVRAIHARREGKDIVLDGFRSVPISGSLEAACRQALELRLGDERVAVAIAGPEVAIRAIELPPMNATELSEALPWEARRHIEGLADDAIVAAHVVGGNHRKDSMEVVLVAVPRNRYREIENVALRLRVTTAFVDVSQLSAMNSVTFSAKPGDAPVAFVDLGDDHAAFSVFHKGSLLLFRDLAPRNARLNALLAIGFGLDDVQVESFKRSGKLPSGETPSRAAVEQALGEVVGDLVEDLRAGQAYVDNRIGEMIDRAFLTGGSTGFFERLGLVDMIGTKSGLSLERHNPLRGFRLGLVDEIALEAAAPELSGVTGLAARFFRD